MLKEVKTEILFSRFWFHILRVLLRFNPPLNPLQPKPLMEVIDDSEAGIQNKSKDNRIYQVTSVNVGSNECSNNTTKPIGCHSSQGSSFLFKHSSILYALREGVK